MRTNRSWRDVLAMAANSTSIKWTAGGVQYRGKARGSFSLDKTTEMQVEVDTVNGERPRSSMRVKLKRGSDGQANMHT
jgi:hypothetical protein